MIKKLATLIVLALFMLSSVSVVLAQNGERVRARVVAEDTEDTDEAPVPTLISAEAGETLRERFQNLNEEQRAKLLELRAEYQRKLATLNEDNVRKLARLGETELNKIAVMSRERVRELSQLSESQIKAQLARVRVKVVEKAQLGKERVIAKQKLTQLKARVQNVKAECAEGHEAYATLKQEFLELRDADPDSEETLAKAKELAKQGAENVICHLETTKAQVEASEELTEDQVTAIVENLDAQMARFNELIDELDEAETKEDIIAIAGRINSRWESTKQKARIHAATLLNAKFKGYFARVNLMENVLERALNYAEENDIDTTSIDAKVEDFSAKLEEARDYYRQSIEKRLEAQEAAKAGENPSTLTQEARDLHNQAVDAAKEANLLLKDIIRELKGINIDVEELAGEDEDQVEVVEEEIEGEDEVLEVVDGDDEEVVVTVTGTGGSDNWCPEGGEWAMEATGAEGELSAEWKIEKIMTEGEYEGLCHVVYTAETTAGEVTMDYYFAEGGETGYFEMDVGGQKIKQEWSAD